MARISVTITFDVEVDGDVEFCRQDLEGKFGSYVDLTYRDKYGSVIDYAPVDVQIEAARVALI